MQAMLLQAAETQTSGTQGDLQRRQIQRLTFRLKVRCPLFSAWDACIGALGLATSKVDMPDRAVESQAEELPLTGAVSGMLHGAHSAPRKGNGKPCIDRASQTKMQDKACITKAAVMLMAVKSVASPHLW